MNCSVKGCESTDNIQYLLVHNKKAPQKERKPELYCQKHLRMRAAQLEFTRLAGVMAKGLGRHT